MRTLAIIPAFNEADTIGEVISSVIERVNEVVVVDDASEDQTAAIAHREGVKVLRHDLNRGIGEALTTGYSYALWRGVELVIQLDADGQHDPCYIPNLISRIEEGCDLVVASRYHDPLDTALEGWRDLGIRFYSGLVAHLTSSRVTDVTSGFRALTARSLSTARTLPPRHWAIYQTLDYLLSKRTYDEVPVPMQPRLHGISQFSMLTALLYHWKVARSIIALLMARIDSKMPGELNGQNSDTSAKDFNEGNHRSELPTERP